MWQVYTKQRNFYAEWSFTVGWWYSSDCKVSYTNRSHPLKKQGFREKSQTKINCVLHDEFLNRQTNRWMTLRGKLLSSKKICVALFIKPRVCAMTTFEIIFAVRFWKRARNVRTHTRVHIYVSSSTLFCMLNKKGRERCRGFSGLIILFALSLAVRYKLILRLSLTPRVLCIWALRHLCVLFLYWFLPPVRKFVVTPASKYT